MGVGVCVGMFSVFFFFGGGGGGARQRATHTRAPRCVPATLLEAARLHAYCWPWLQVVVPRTYSDFTTRRVLTTEWLEGEKLSQSQADDVGKLVQVRLVWGRGCARVGGWAGSLGRGSGQDERAAQPPAYGVSPPAGTAAPPCHLCGTAGERPRDAPISRALAMQRMPTHPRATHAARRWASSAT